MQPRILSSIAPAARRLVMLAALASLAVLAVPSARADQLDDILAAQVLRVAVPKEFPPFGYMKDGAPVGYDIAVARMLAREMKVRLEIVPVVSGERLSHLQNGKVDLIISSLGKNAEREKAIDFTMPYAPMYLGVFGPNPAPIAADAAYFKGRRIGVTKGSLEEEEVARKLPGAEIVRYEHSAAIIEAYVKNEVEYIAVPNVVVEAIADVRARDRAKRVLVLKDSPCYIGVRKNEPRLLARVNQFLAQAAQSEVLAVNAMVWFKMTFPPDFFARKS
jgi:polar amino acid transport system substrate-binding protein